MITKSELRRYIDLQDQEEDLVREIAELRAMAENASGIAFDGVRVQSSYNGSSQEIYIEKIEKLIMKYKDKINEIVTLRERIEDEVSRLSAEDQRLIRLKYFDGLSGEECSKRLYISLRTFNYWHASILLKLAQQK
ncbi:MAG: hypothetical protein IKV80_08375 [Bacteroidales bacterium]|jgi:DNA-directed RNA polymerase specialized sigma24 family protein|nr:hypothetical protein [Bacteroidales bacterium]